MFHWPGLQNRQQTVGWRHWIRNCPNVLADWRQCCYLNLSTSQSQFCRQWSSLQPSLHQLVLLTTLSPSLSLSRLTDQPLLTRKEWINWSMTLALHQQPAYRPKSDNLRSTTIAHQQLTNPPATLHQQPAHRPKTDNWPSGTNQLTKLASSTASVEVQQTPETDVDTSSDSDSRVCSA